MSGELQAQAATGANVYAIILNASGQAWYTVTPAFEAINAAHWTSYAITLTEAAGTGLYVGNFPTAIVTFGQYSALVYQRAGSSPADTDTLVAAGLVNWSGTAALNPTGTNSTGQVLVQYPIAKNTAINNFQFPMTLAVDHISPYTGAGNTVSGKVALDGTEAALTNSAAISAVTGMNGVYYINLAAADLNGNSVCLVFSAAGCDDTKIFFATQA